VRRKGHKAGRLGTICVCVDQNLTTSYIRSPCLPRVVLTFTCLATALPENVNVLYVGQSGQREVDSICLCKQIPLTMVGRHLKPRASYVYSVSATGLMRPPKIRRFLTEPFGATITHHRMPPDTVVCRLVAWRPDIRLLIRCTPACDLMPHK
jgi:hypothetical protein